MDSADIMKVIIIFGIFMIIYFLIYLSVGVKSIKSNWQEYRCNPIIMPFAKFFGKDPIQNFQSCIQNIQNIHMGSLLDPVYHLLSNAANIGNTLNNGLLGFAGIMNLLKVNLGTTANLAVEIIINILIEMQSLLIKFKDMINKLIGVFITFIYIIAGTQITTLTLWEALPGWLVKKLAGFSDNSKDDTDSSDEITN